jgi:DNA-binding NarL/FixJ family response regulator
MNYIDLESTRGRPVPIRILIADDEALIRAGLALILKTEPDMEIVAEAQDGDEAVSLAHSEMPDVVLMDVRMPNLDGVAATKQIVADAFSDQDPIKILILTTFNTDEAVYGAIKAGASGFILKHAAPKELVAAIHAVARGDAWLDPMVARNLMHEFASRPDAQVPTPAELSQLTKREVAILVEVAHGFSNAQIAQRLVLSEATVKTHLSRVLLKLGLRDRAQAVGVAYRTRLVGPDDTPPPAPGLLGDRKSDTTADNAPAKHRR